MLMSHSTLYIYQRSELIVYANVHTYAQHFILMILQCTNYQKNTVMVLYMFCQASVRKLDNLNLSETVKFKKEIQQFRINHMRPSSVHMYWNTIGAKTMRLKNNKSNNR